MKTSKILLTTSKLLTLETAAPSEEKLRESPLSFCFLQWRRGQLWVSQAKERGTPCLPSLENEQWFLDCLKHSPVKRVCLDSELGEVGIRLWADACEQTNKQVFLRVPCNSQLPSKHYPRSWWFKRLVDRSASALLLLLFSPVMLGLILLMRLYSPGPVFFRQWRVGERGKLFRVLKFRTMMVDAQKLHHQVTGNREGLHKREDDPRVTPLGRWLRKYNLDELPQLVNVLRGEMSLVGPRPLALYDAARINPEGRQRLKALPGMIGVWQIETRSNLLELQAVNRCDLEYLRTWTLWRDFKILLLTLPKVLSGFGAY